MAGVLALAEAVHNAPNVQAAKHRSAELVQAARETSILTNQLLSFERAGGKELDQSGEPLDLKALVEQVVDSFRQQNSDTKIEIFLGLPEADVRIQGDAVMLQEAILNILTNSVVHGGSRVSKISLDLSCARGQAVLSIRDDGVGIPAKDHVEAVSRFGQTRGGPGSGLGLPIAARVMKNHGGALRIEDVSSGTMIVLIFPIEGD